MFKEVCFCISQGLLLTAALMDLFSNEVYDFIWMIFVPLCTVLLFVSGNATVTVLISLFIYFIIQEILMARVYGRADCHALWCCALLFSAFGSDLEAYTMHMGVTFFLMCIIQYFKGNIGPGLKLKKKIAMIPYILVGFWLVFVICVP